MNAEQTGRLIAARRRELGLSQTELADRLHVTDKAVSRWETGRGMPAVDTLEPLAEALGLTVSELLSGQRLTPEELPKTADGLLTESLRRNVRMVWRSVLGVLLAVAVTGAAAAGCYAGYHWWTSVPETDTEGLTRQAAAYLGASASIRLAELDRKGDYLAALCADDAGNWCMCVYDRDPVFQDRWRGGGGKPALTAGKLGSWNFGNSREAVIIFCGGDLPPEAAYYTFQNSGITYTCPIENGQVLDLFLLPDTRDISSYPEQLLDEAGQPLDRQGFRESDVLSTP